MNTLDDVMTKIEDLRGVDKEKASDLWEMYTKLSMAGGRLKRGLDYLEKKGFASTDAKESLDALMAEIKQYKDAC